MVNDGLITERRNDGLEIDRKGENVTSLEGDFDGISSLFRVFITLKFVDDMFSKTIRFSIFDTKIFNRRKKLLENLEISSNTFEVHLRQDAKIFNDY